MPRGLRCALGIAAAAGGAALWSALRAGDCAALAPLDPPHLHQDPAHAGPMQDDELLLLYALLRVLRPAVAAEFGVQSGASTRTALAALLADGPHGRLFAYDINNVSRNLGSVAGRDARWQGGSWVSHGGRFNLTVADQKDWRCGWVGGAVDFALIDSCHDLECYQKLWRHLGPCMTPDAVAVVHDTGLHSGCPDGPLCGRGTRVISADGKLQAIKTRSGIRWVPSPLRYRKVCDHGGCGMVNRPGNREFVNWVATAEGGMWQVQALHTTRTYRHGVSLLSRPDRPPYRAPPPTTPGPPLWRRQQPAWPLPHGGSPAALLAAGVARALRPRRAAAAGAPPAALAAALSPGSEPVAGSPCLLRCPASAPPLDLVHLGGPCGAAAWAAARRCLAPGGVAIIESPAAAAAAAAEHPRRWTVAAVGRRRPCGQGLSVATRRWPPLPAG